MFTYATLISFFACLLLGISCTSYQSDQNTFLQTEEFNPQMSNNLSEGGFHGKFGVTWFPRCRFGGTFGGVVIGWPAKGGYYSHLCSAAELEFLGIDRFKPANKSDEPVKEEAHCAKMRQLGAKWYRDPFHQLSDQDKNDDPDAPRLFVGWPADGGVWAIHTTLFESEKRGLGRIGNAFTMLERCEVIKQLGGSFYKDPKECSFLDLDGSKDEEK